MITFYEKKNEVPFYVCVECITFDGFTDLRLSSHIVTT